MITMLVPQIRFVGEVFHPSRDGVGGVLLKGELRREDLPSHLQSAFDQLAEWVKDPKESERCLEMSAGDISFYCRHESVLF